MKNIWGKIVYYFTKALEFIYDLVEKILEVIINAADSIRLFIIPIVLFFVIGIVTIPLLLLLVFTGPGAFLLIATIVVFSISILGRSVLNSFRKVKYVQINFLYDYARYEMEGGVENKSYQFYKDKYDEIQRQKFEEELRREEERRRERQRQQEKQWREFFEQNFGGYSSSQGGYGGYQGSSSQGRPGAFVGFKQKYEEACDVLGVPYDADFSTIKAAYRKLAKKYHPDISKERHAEEMFKKVNNAFDFLSEENVRRYKNI
ncbi:DnaJ domain-containing protein [uncultured Helcococcus sp.]|uniref:DnaJ domain-containing protein n=1 Tax=uncultured Helcococcus sp. TaxID=1072508 RepID=UPI00288C1C29|nr:DnaJ domain-containing protein [uncultured Helcococcus sp.]